GGRLGRGHALFRDLRLVADTTAAGATRAAALLRLVADLLRAGSVVGSAGCAVRRLSFGAVGISDVLRGPRIGLCSLRCRRFLERQLRLVVAAAAERAAGAPCLLPLAVALGGLRLVAGSALSPVGHTPPVAVGCFERQIGV